MHRVFTAFALCLLLVNVCGCASGGTCRVESDPDALSLHLDSFSGTYHASLALHAGDEVAFSVTRQSGRVDLSLALDTPLYTGNDAQSGTFTVVIPTDGDYTFTLTGKRAGGDVILTWGEG